MDGLSGFASVVAVLDLSAKLSSTCYRYYRSAKGAKEEIQSILDELSSLQLVLRRIETLETDSSTSSSVVHEILRSPNGPLYQCGQSLNQLLIKLESCRSLTWPLKSNEVESHLVAIERLKTTFILALSTDHRYVCSVDVEMLTSSLDDVAEQASKRLTRT